MADVDVQKLSLTVEYKDGGAPEQVDALAAALASLKDAADGLDAVGFSALKDLKVGKDVADSITKVADALKGFQAGVPDLSGLAPLGSLKVGKDVGDNIAKVGAAIKGMGGNIPDLSRLSALNGFTFGKAASANLSALADALKGLPPDIPDLSWVASLNGISVSKTIPQNISTLADALVKLHGVALPDLSWIAALNKVTVSSTLAKNLAPLASSLSGLSNVRPIKQDVIDNLAKLAAALQQFQGLQGIDFSGIAKLNAQMTKAEQGTRKVTGGLAQLKVGAIAAFLAMRRVIGQASTFIRESSEYVESLNLFAVSMGDYGREAYDYARKVSGLMGIDVAEWFRAQGVMDTILTGFGVAQERASVMSKQLTQLGYDISSFYNIDVADAFAKLQSGIAGELEPLRRIGYDLSNARLQQEALALGIKKHITDMTQAEKAMLRYHTIMTQVTQVQGDMARTLQQPANQLRVFNAQVQMLVRDIGNLLIPVLNMVLPYIMAIVKGLRMIAVELAHLFGVELPEMPQYDAGAVSVVADEVDGLGGSLDDADKAAKKLQRTIMSFDEVYALGSPDTGGAGAGAAGGGALDIPLETYDFLKGLQESMTAAEQAVKPFFDWVAAHLEEIAALVKTIGLGIIAWKLKDALLGAAAMGGLGKRLKELFSGLVVTAGIMLAIDSIKDVFVDGLSPKSVLKGIAAGLLVGLGSVFTKGVKGALLTAMVSVGVILSIQAIMDEVKNGLNAGNAVVGGIAGALAGAGIGLMKMGGVAGALVGVTLGAGIILSVMGITSIVREGLGGANAAVTAIGAALLGAGIGLVASSKLGLLGLATGGVGALVGVGVALSVMGVSVLVNDPQSMGATIAALLATVLGPALIGTGLGILTGVGAAVGATAGLAVGAVLAVVAIDILLQKRATDAMLESMHEQMTYPVERLQALVNEELSSIKADFAPFEGMGVSLRGAAEAAGKAKEEVGLYVAAFQNMPSAIKTSVDEMAQALDAYITNASAALSQSAVIMAGYVDTLSDEALRSAGLTRESLKSTLDAVGPVVDRLLAAYDDQATRLKELNKEFTEGRLSPSEYAKSLQLVAVAAGATETQKAAGAINEVSKAIEAVKLGSVDLKDKDAVAEAFRGIGSGAKDASTAVNDAYAAVKEAIELNISEMAKAGLPDSEAMPLRMMLKAAEKDRDLNLQQIKDLVQGAWDSVAESSTASMQSSFDKNIAEGMSFRRAAEGVKDSINKEFLPTVSTEIKKALGQDLIDQLGLTDKSEALYKHIMSNLFRGNFMDSGGFGATRIIQNDLRQVISDGIDAVDLKGLDEVLGKKVGSVVDGIAPRVSAAAKGIPEGVQQAVDSATLDWGQYAKAGVKNFQKANEMASPSKLYAREGRHIPEGVQQAVDTFTFDMTKMAANMLAAARSAFSAASKDFAALGAGVAKAASDALGAAKADASAASRFIAAVKASLTAATGAAGLGQVGAGVAEAVTGGLNKAAAVTTAFLATVRASLLAAAQAAGLDAVGASIASLVTGGLDAAQARTRFIDSLKASLQQAVAAANFRDIGTQVAEGVIQGLDQYKVNTSKFVNTLKQDMSSRARISSPSRLFRDEVGRYVAAGVELGVNQYQPDTSGFLGALAGAMALPVPTPTAAAPQAATAAWGGHGAPGGQASLERRVDALGAKLDTLIRVLEGKQMSVSIDGREVAASVTEHQARDFRMRGAVPYYMN